ncbi:PREDICTED: ribonuclease II, chloroplastic/mitochondrial isoform X2 [Nelumbo nucifera]|uniref:Ribonuclease II, chloroplastic/mitochondrial isoform X2 n=1 Tax=Nelumbo nucifera TaxID=4432 RepID=A0A1U8Q5H8_NELNU|nr:PREDICTED: ribonuclease II, chloroplastic/mitochondrial isoform X2 [Nelumbo nucifera]
MTMAVRAANSCSVFRSVSSPPFSSFPCRLSHFAPSRFRGVSKLRFQAPASRPEKLLPYWGILSCSVYSLVESVMEELEVLRARKRVYASSKVGLVSSGQLVEGKVDKRVLQKGLLLEFRKDSERVLLAVAQKPDGKKNWVVSDQNGVTSSIKPQQITFIVPGVENFDHTEISDFIEKAHKNLDPTLLEYAWMELLEKNKSVTAEELAEVEELLRRKHAKEEAEKELQEFVGLLMSAKGVSLHSKPPKESWTVDDKIQHRIESLEAYAIDACKNDDQKKTAGVILKAMGLPRTSSSAVNLLIDIGYFPVHVNLDLLKFNVHTEYSDEILSAAESLLLDSSDPDEMERKDLTHLKVYAIDVDEADELDDALSATRLQDGRIKVWIHVADPTSLVQPGSKIDREAMRKGTSIFLPTATFPMFPEKLAMEGMSLKQGKVCNAVSVSVVLHHGGGIAEYTVENSIIRPTYMLTYESASELIHLNLEEEAELRILSEAAALRLQWRRQQGAIDTATIDTRIKVANPDDLEPSINLYVENQADPAMRLVSEMMILCGEVIATFGSCNNIPLPYRGQPQSNIDASAFSHLPEGPVRSSAYVKIMRAAEMDFRKPIRHGVLGIPGYVQFTSPIRRYMDLLAHYQVKAFLRGDSLPYSAGQLEGMASLINMRVRVAKRLYNSSLRYWLLEFLRRQPKEKKFRALILRFIKDRVAALFLTEVGIQASAWVSVGSQIGDEIEVWVEEAHPRDDVLSLKEVA